jgi:HlyD family secretion protein
VRRRLLVPAVLVGTAAVALAGRAILGRYSASGADVPVLEVRPAPFARTISAEGYLRPVKASPVTAPSEGRSLLIAWMAEDGAAVKKGEVVVRFDSEQALRELADGKDDQNAATTRIAKEQAAVDSSLADRARAAALTREEIVKARQLGKKDPRFFPRTEVIESQIDEALLASRLQQTEQSGTVERRLGKSRVALIAVDRHKATLELADASKTLEALEVRAPHDGIFVVQRMGWAQRMIQAGDRAFTGMRIAEVATSDRMDAEVMVLEADAGGLTSGKRATVILDARPDRVIKAKVKKVDAFPKPKHPEVPAQYFGAILSLEGDSSGLKPGQRLRATLVMDELPAALVVPRQAVFRKDDDTFVERRQKWSGRFERVPVTLGPGTVGRVVVTGGLGAGDVIALRDPRRSADQAASAAAAERPRVGRAPPGGGRGRGGRD